MEMILAATNWDPRKQVIRIAPGDDYDEQPFESDDEDMDPAEPARFRKRSRGTRPLMNTPRRTNFVMHRKIAKIG
jgi:hypothetical protein